MTKLELTEEQKEIINTDANTLLVNAFAGTGKTSTLVEFARARPNKNFIYLAFNRSVKEDAVKKFPKNVYCTTTHGLAYQYFGVSYKHKLGQPKSATISKMFKCSFSIADAANQTLNAFLCSADTYLDEEKHLVSGILGELQAERAFQVAKDVWKSMQDKNNIYVKMPHDGYLKLFQLAQPNFDNDYYMVDEAQDSNMLVIDIVSRQLGKKLFIGDENQSIYQFRKAVDALNHVEADSKLYLTSSFRFGKGIAELATFLLQEWKKETKIVKGLGKHSSNFFVNEMSPHTILARTNSGLFDAAVKSLKSGVPFGYLGGYEGYRLDMILDAWNLKKFGPSKVLDPSILLFKSYEELEAYADTVDDKELKMLIRTIDKYGSDIPHLIDDLKNKSIKTLTGNEIILSTAHKSKGLEFPSVVLLDDFCELKIEIDNKGKETGPSVEDINILYVAMTRAEQNLKLNEKTKDWLFDIGKMHYLSNLNKKTHP